MFVHPRRLKTQGAYAATALALIACGTPEARTDLRPEGDPEVLAVLVLNDSVDGLVEGATYCAPGDEKRPGLVAVGPLFITTQVCPDDLSAAAPMLTDAAPDTFYVRIMFDELLDPNIEELIPIFDENGLETGSFTGTLANTQPVTLKCTGVDGMSYDLAYDGYYSPSGNNVTWPLGPSLVIKPLGDVIVPTNSECTVELKDNITDKTGNKVPGDQRGPFRFKMSGVKPLVIDPADGSTVTANAIYGDNFYIQLNAEVTGASGVGQTAWCTQAGASQFSGCASDLDFAIEPQPKSCVLDGFGCNDTVACAAISNNCVATECEETGDPCTTVADCPQNTCETAPLYAYSLFPFGLSRSEWGFGPFGYPETEKMYTFEIKQGAMLTDRCGAVTTFGAPSVADNTKTTVTTAKFAFAAASPFSPVQGDVIPANRKITVTFNTPLRHTYPAFTPDLDPTMVVVDPQPFSAPGTPITNASMVRYPPTGAENAIFLRGHYQPDTNYTFTLKAGAVFKDNYGKEVTNPADKVIMFKTQPIAVTASSPASGATITKATPGSATNILFTFNQSMDLTTFTADDIELTGTPTTLTFGRGTAATSGTAASDCGISSNACRMRVSGVFTPGEYSIKLKAGAVIKDALGNDYTQAADRIIKFTVREAPPATVVPCLGM